MSSAGRLPTAVAHRRQHETGPAAAGLIDTAGGAYRRRRVTARADSAKPTSASDARSGTATCAASARIIQNWSRTGGASWASRRRLLWLWTPREKPSAKLPELVSWKIGKLPARAVVDE